MNSVALPGKLWEHRTEKAETSALQHGERERKRRGDWVKKNKRVGKDDTDKESIDEKRR